MLITFTLFYALIELTHSVHSVVMIHGATYAIRNKAINSYLTANRQAYRDVGLRGGNVTVEPFDITKYEFQFFDSIFIGNYTTKTTNISQEEQSQLYWLVPHRAVFNILTINPLSIFPMKNFVVLMPLPGSDEFLIRSYELNKCLQAKGENQSVFYTACDLKNTNQQFLADFLYEERKDVSEFQPSSDNIDILF